MNHCSQIHDKYVFLIFKQSRSWINTILKQSKSSYKGFKNIAY